MDSGIPIKVSCPHTEGQDDEEYCVYIDEDANCDDLEINSGNSDAWCFCIYYPEDCSGIEAD